jgi:hypothetical protein
MVLVGEPGVNSIALGVQDFDTGRTVLFYPFYLIQYSRAAEI